MKKNAEKKIRKLAVLLIAVLSINSFAAIVGDNDGSAFITKAEFDSLKSSFQSQVDNYNSSIDSKIDGAIASYLAGISVAKKEVITNLLNSVNSYQFVNNWTIGQNLGLTSRTSGFVQIAYVGARVINNANAVECKMMSGNADYPIEVIYPTSNTPTNWSKLLSISNSTFNSSKYIISDVIEEQPSFCLALFFQSFNLVSNPNLLTITPESLSLERGSGEDKIGSYPASVSFQFGLSSPKTLSGYKVYGLKDTSLSNNKGFIAGGAVSTQQVPACMANELSLLGNQSTFVHGTTGWKGVYKDNTEYGSGWTNSIAVKYGGYAYHHKTKNIKISDDIILDDISTLSGKATTYFNGLPLFYVTKTGNIKFQLKATESGNTYNTTIQVNDDQFANEEITGGCGSLGWTIKKSDGTTSDWSLMSGATYTLEGPVSSGTQYWIKARPAGGSGNSSKLEIVGDIVLDFDN